MITRHFLASVRYGRHTPGAKGRRVQSTSLSSLSSLPPVLYVTLHSPDCVFLKTSVSLVGGLGGYESFSTSGRRMLVPGFTEIQPFAAFEDTTVPPFVVGEKVPLHCIGQLFDDILCASSSFAAQMSMTRTASTSTVWCVWCYDAGGGQVDTVKARQDTATAPPHRV